MQLTSSAVQGLGDFARLAIGEIITLGGIFGCILYVFRRRRSDRSELWFGLGALLYGGRMICEMDAFRSVPSFPAETIHLLATLFVSIPLTLFFEQMLLPGRTRIMAAVAAAQLALAAAGITSWIEHWSLEPVFFVNGIFGIVIALALPLLIFFARQDPAPELRVFRIAAIIFAAFVLNQNLRALGIPNIEVPSIGGNLEPIGMFIYLGALGYVALARTLRTEQSWVSVHRELEIAREIQQGLLPATDSHPGPLRIHARYLPAASVAGDFYDLLHGHNSMGALIADVSGHGIPAALSASMVKIALKTQAAHCAAPASVLAGLNSALNGSLHGQFITAAYVFVDPEEKILRYAGAGHPPLLLQRGRDGAVEQLEENGLFLGPFPFATYTEQMTSFLPGDRCLLYTDGLTEAADRAGEEFGSERLSAFLAEHASLPSGSLCDTLLARITSWTGAAQGNLADDITLLLLEFPA